MPRYGPVHQRNAITAHPGEDPGFRGWRQRGAVSASSNNRGSHRDGKQMTTKTNTDLHATIEFCFTNRYKS